MARPSPTTWHYAIDRLLDEADRTGRPSTESLDRTARTLGVSTRTVESRFHETAHRLDRRGRLSPTAVEAVRDAADIPAAIAVLRSLGDDRRGAELERAIRRHRGGALIGLVRRTDEPSS